MFCHLFRTFVLGFPRSVVFLLFTFLSCWALLKPTIRYCVFSIIEGNKVVFNCYLLLHFTVAVICTIYNLKTSLHVNIMCRSPSQKHRHWSFVIYFFFVVCLICSVLYRSSFFLAIDTFVECNDCSLSYIVPPVANIISMFRTIISCLLIL